jgi:hypothetical protein
VIVNVDPGSAVPLIVGVLSLVRRALVGLAIVGAVGESVSTTTERVCAELVFHAASVAVIESILAHSERGDDGVNTQFPDPSAVTVPSVFPDPSCISTVLFASAVPVMVGVVSLVRYGALVSPATFEITGVDGVVESIERVTEAVVLEFPTASVSTTLKVLDPSGRETIGVNE